MTSGGVLAIPSSRMRYVFCQSWPKPWTGPTSRRPATLRLTAPGGTSPTRSLPAGTAQLAASSRTLGVSTGVLLVITRRLRLRRRDRRGLGVVDPDRFVEPGQLEDLLVVLVEPTGEKLLLLPIGADQERHEQPDAATVHVVGASEVQHDRAGLIARLAIRGHEWLLRGRGHIAAHADDDRPLVDSVARRCRRRCGHVASPPFNAALSSA